jgi:hypothetical protein
MGNLGCRSRELAPQGELQRHARESRAAATFRSPGSRSVAERSAIVQAALARSRPATADDQVTRPAICATVCTKNSIVTGLLRHSVKPACTTSSTSSSSMAPESARAHVT